MKVIKVAPESNHLEGYAEIRIPPYVERLKIIQDNKLADDKVDTIEKSRRVIDVVTRQVQSVDVTFSNGEKASSVEELGYYAEGVEFINSLASVLMQGATLSDDGKKI